MENVIREQNVFFRLGLLLALLACLSAFLLGGVFGLFNDEIKAWQKDSIKEAALVMSQGDDAKYKEIYSEAYEKARSYTKRTHLHAGAIGAAVLGVILTGLFMGLNKTYLGIASFAAGAGAGGYGFFGWGTITVLTSILADSDRAKEIVSPWMMLTGSLAMLGTFMIVLAAIFLVFSKKPQGIFLH